MLAEQTSKLCASYPFRNSANPLSVLESVEDSLHVIVVVVVQVVVEKTCRTARDRRWATGSISVDHSSEIHAAGREAVDLDACLKISFETLR